MLQNLKPVVKKIALHHAAHLNDYILGVIGSALDHKILTALGVLSCLAIFYTIQQVLSLVEVEVA